MNVIFTCGGTGGHINPAIAVANTWKEKYPDSRILFIGGQGGMEQRLIPDAGYELIALPAHGMARGKSFRAIKKNISLYDAYLRYERKQKQSVEKAQKQAESIKQSTNGSLSSAEKASGTQDFSAFNSGVWGYKH